MFRIFFAAILLLGSTQMSFAQKKGNLYTPFVVDSVAVTAILKVKNSPLEDQFAAVFKEHKLNAASPEDWQGLLEMIAGMKETDLVISREISFETNEDNVELSAINFDNLEQMVKSLRLVIATPQKVDAFLIDMDSSSPKKKK